MARALLAAASIIESGELDAFRNDALRRLGHRPTARSCWPASTASPTSTSGRSTPASRRRSAAARSSSRTSSPATSNAPADAPLDAARRRGRLVHAVDQGRGARRRHRSCRRHRDAPSTRRPRRRCPNRTRARGGTRSVAAIGTARRPPPRRRGDLGRRPAARAGAARRRRRAGAAGQAVERHDLGAAGRAVGASSSAREQWAALTGSVPVASFTITQAGVGRRARARRVRAGRRG